MSTDAIEEIDDLLSIDELPADRLTERHRFLLSDLLENAKDRQELERLAERALDALSEHGENLRAWYAVAVYQDLTGDSEQAGQQFSHLACELARQDDWAGGRQLALRSLPLSGDERAARLIIESFEHLPENANVGGDISAIEDYCPNSPHLLWHKAQSADEGGDDETAVQLSVRALRHFIRLEEAENVEEPLLTVLGSDDPAVYRSFLLLWPRMAAAGMDDILEMSLELIEPEVEKLQLHEDLATALERILTDRDHLQHLRPKYVEALAHSIDGNTLESRQFIAECGLANEDVPFEEALGRFRNMFKFRPGAFVEHHSFGVGRIQAKDGDFLVIDFEGKPNHRMALEIAKRSLRPLPADCLRAVLLAEPEKIKTEAEQDPVKLLVRALSDEGGEAKARDLRELLAGNAVPESDWSSWWQNVRDAAKTDERVDTSQAFRQLYRLPTETEDDEVELPPLPVKEEVKPAVNLINRFLRQHSELDDRAKAEYGEKLVHRVEAAAAPEALVAIPLLMRWFPEKEQQWQKIVRRGLRTEPGVAACSTSDAQMELLKAGLKTGAWQEAALTALGSRFRSVREKGLQQLRQRLDEELSETIRRVAFERENFPATRLAIVKLYLNEAIDRSIFNPCEIIRILAGVMATAEERNILTAARELMGASGTLCELLRQCQPDEEDIEQLRGAITELTDRQITTRPVQELLKWADHDDIAQGLFGGNDLIAQSDPIELHYNSAVMLMTEATYTENQEQIDELEDRLANEIPQAIAEARALGDLSENAAYDAAREEQGIADANLRSLKSLMDKAVLIEDLDIPDETAAAGTEVVVEDLDTGENQTLWILGQGDSERAETVINYQAPLGQALVGHQPGDIVECRINGDEQRLKILSVTEKLPQ